MMNGLYILLGALLLDLLAAEAPNRFHPVAWLGKLISLQLKLVPAGGNARQFICGAAMVILTMAIITVPLVFLKYHWEAAAEIYPLTINLQSLSTIAYLLFSIYLLKNTFSLRGLWLAVQKVKISLAGDDLVKARWHTNALVSRKTENLSQEQVISAAIESCSENLCDSFVAPLFYYSIFGLPGAVAYRIVNTFDAMIGFHGKWEYTGKFAARLDDVINFIPARLSGAGIFLATALCGADAAQSWRTMLGQHGNTESPNAGWTMGAMAGSLGITLEKQGAYCLNGGSSQLTVADITRSQNIVITAAAIWATMITGIEVLIGLAG